MIQEIPVGIESPVVLWKGKIVEMYELDLVSFNFDKKSLRFHPYSLL